MRREKVLRCPLCRQESECFHQDVGGVDYMDEYVLYCVSCGHTERRSVYGGSPLGNNWTTSCPFCGIECYIHEKTPPQLWGYSKRYLLLYQFSVSDQLLQIAIRDEKIVLETIIQFPLIPLNLPLPYNKDEIGIVSEYYNSIGLDFKTLEAGTDYALIEISIRKRQGYWYYGSLEDATPPVEISTRRLRVRINQEAENSKDRVTCFFEGRG